MATNGDLVGGSDDAFTIASFPVSLLRAELARRQTSDSSEDAEPARPECGTTGTKYNYNTSLHVFALFLILFISTAACSFPLIVRRYPKLPVPNKTLFLSRHFGTGVLIATAFVHLLPTAFTSLTDSCLPSFWNETYPAFPGFLAMVSVLVVVGIEMFFATKGAAHSCAAGIDLERLKTVPQDAETSDVPGLLTPRKRSKRTNSSARFRPANLHVGDGDDEQEDPWAKKSPYVDSPGSLDKALPPPPPQDDEDDNDSDLDLAELEHDHGDREDAAQDEDDDDDARLLNGGASSRGRGHRKDSNGSLHHGSGRSRTVSFASPATSPTRQAAASPPSQTQAGENRLILQVFLLEAGIIFHSVFIGLALSVSTGPAFIVLLIAISFHQCFEGLALGSRIAAIPTLASESIRPWLMCLMYGITTPVGQAIGLAVHTLYDPASQFGLLTVGIVNAISSGLLLYAGLVQLMAEDFLSDQSYAELKGKRRLQACGSVVAGCLLMSAVGAFA